MKTVLYAISMFMMALGITMIVSACKTMQHKIETKAKPQYVGVDDKLKPYVDEFIELSKRHNLHFDHQVTVGMKTIGEGNVIGLCHRRGDWREVDIDTGFFESESKLRGKILVFHELTHCYCTRGHDFDGVDYPNGLIGFMDVIKAKSAKVIPWCIARAIPGYLEDGCPATIMHPYIIDQFCIDQHYDYYIDEMFKSCEPF